MQYIDIRGARTHNLKNINLVLPRDKFIVITGLSGSGKSSLAFDTLYAKRQRRYVESLSAYARQFLSLMEKPDVDHIKGLSPAISIEQKSTSHNPRSTVGTVTEIHDYLRLLFARVGEPRCPEHDLPLAENDFRIECSQDGVHFSQLRICHLNKATDKIRFGLYACSPENSSFTAVFSEMKMEDCVWEKHNGQLPDGS